MGDENAEPTKRKSEWITSYSNMSLLDAEKRLGFMMQTFESGAISVKEMLATSKDRVEGRDEMLRTKQKVYARIMEYLEAEGYPTEADVDFKKANVSDLVFAIIIPIIADFKRKTGRSIGLRREKEIVGVDFETGGTQEFVMMDLISVMERNFVFVIEAKRSSLGEEMKQCLLSMKDMRDNNGDGEVYGFVTNGEHWQMVRYDGMYFTLTDSFQVVFRTMGKDNEKWIKENSVVVDCMNFALSNGGIVKKDVVA